MPPPLVADLSARHCRCSASSFALFRAEPSPLAIVMSRERTSRVFTNSELWPASEGRKLHPETVGLSEGGRPGGVLIDIGGGTQL
jgi:hypothetical protein